MRNFRNYEIWKECIEIVKIVYSISSLLPKEEKFGICSQIQRAAVSIPSNIAEGCSRNSEIEFKRFLEIALGSAFEIETQLLIISELKMIDEKEINNTISRLNSLQQ